jgi:hypothetical protein
MASVAVLTLLFVGIGLFARRFNPPIKVLLVALIAGVLVFMYLT